MIRSFGCKLTEALYNGEPASKARKAIPADLKRKSLLILQLLNEATTLEDMGTPPSLRLHPLQGKWRKFHSISINARYRILFRWTSSGPENVQINDHSY